MSLLNIWKSIAAVLLLTILFTFEASAHAQSWSATAEQVAQLAEWREQAEAGDPNAQFNLGYMNDTGSDRGIIPKDTRKAAEWYEKAALQGHAKAQSALGHMFISGYGVPKNDVIGVGWLQKAADQGDADAQLALGWLYADSKGIPDDPAKALQWWQHAAERDFAHAQFMLGMIYYKGEIVPRDLTKTVELWTRASLQGYHPAQSNLGTMYHSGEGVPKDLAQAVELWEKAAKFGYADAQYKLALAYHLGNGVKKNELLAYVWSSLAAENDDSVTAKSLRNSIILTKDQKEQANEMFMNWQLGQVYRSSASYRLLAQNNYYSVRKNSSIC